MFRKSTKGRFSLSHSDSKLYKISFFIIKIKKKLKKDEIRKSIIKCSKKKRKINKIYTKNKKLITMAFSSIDGARLSPSLSLSLTLSFVN
jgi:hypothetical protein